MLLILHRFTLVAVNPYVAIFVYVSGFWLENINVCLAYRPYDYLALKLHTGWFVILYYYMLTRKITRNEHQALRDIHVSVCSPDS